MRRQDPKAAGMQGKPPPAKMEALAQKREAALEGLRARMKNVGVPPRIRSKRDRSANQENR